MMKKLQEFWRAIEHWNSQSDLKITYSPLPLGHRSTLKTTQDEASNLRYLLLRLLSNKIVGVLLVPRILGTSYRRGMSFGLRAFLRAAKLECHNRDDIDLMYSIFTLDRHLSSHVMTAASSKLG